jgi:hypothetical protein
VFASRCCCSQPTTFKQQAAAVDKAWLVRKVFLCASPLEQPLLAVFDHDYLAFETVSGSEKRFYTVEKVKATRPEETVLLNDGPTFDSVYRRYGGGIRRTPTVRNVHAFRPTTPLANLLQHIQRHMLRPYKLLQDDCGTFAQELFDLASLSCGQRVSLNGYTLRAESQVPAERVQSFVRSESAEEEGSESQVPVRLEFFVRSAEEEYGSPEDEGSNRASAQGLASSGPESFHIGSDSGDVPSPSRIVRASTDGFMEVGNNDGFEDHDLE